MNLFHFNVPIPWWSILLTFAPAVVSVVQIIVPALRWKDWSLKYAQLIAILWTIGVASLLFYLNAQVAMIQYFEAQHREWTVCVAQKNFDACKVRK